MGKHTPFDLAKHLLASTAFGGILAVSVCGAGAGSAMAQSNETLLVAGPRMPESLDQEYPPT